MEILNVDTPRQSLRNVRVGDNVRIFNFVNAYECTIGAGSKVGAFVEIQKGAFIGENCKISSHSFICEGVHIGNGVFIGHHVAFINDKYPRAVNPDGSMQTEADWEVVETHIGDGASIGTGSTILGGIRIGTGAMVGAGSVVTRDVPDHAVVAGNPARIIRQHKEGNQP
ncbi:MAG: N-acetyltransferase [Saprospiraceae bacterium]|jgi:acetyltransferase-like isoleucine patch superfamily enzyme|nr:N-acetyltransferase [Saprospiraceae bacterium]